MRSSATVDDLIIRIRTLGAAAAAAEVEGAEGKLGSLGKTAKTVSGIAGIGGIAFGLKDMTQAAIKFQAQIALTQTALKNTGQYSQDNIKKLSDAADSMATHGGFDPSTSIQGMRQLVTAHDSVAQAIKDETLVTDIARASHVNYWSALRAVMQVEQGRTTGLARMGVTIPPVTTATQALTTAHTEGGKALAAYLAAHQHLAPALLAEAAAHNKLTPAMTATAKEQDVQATKTEAMRVLWQRFGGAMKTYSDTAAGAASNFRNSIDILGQRLGTFLLPAVTSVIHVLASVTAFFVENKAAAIALAGALGSLAALWTVSKIVEFAGWLSKTTELLGLQTAATWAMNTALTAFMGEEAAAAMETMGLTGALTAMMAIPIVALLAGITFGVVELVKHFGSVKSAIGDAAKAVVSAFNSIKSVVTTVVNWVLSHWKLLILAIPGLGIVIDIVVTHFRAIKTAVSDAVNFAVARFKDFVQLVSPIATAIWNVVTWPFRQVVTIAGTIWAQIRGPLSQLPGLVNTIMSSLWNVLTWPFRQAIQFAQTLVQWIGKVLGPLKSLVNTVSSIGGGIFGGLSSAANFVTGGATGGATGGYVRDGGMFDVGERGREKVVLPSGSLIVPHHYANTGLGTDGNVVIENHATFAIGAVEFARAVQYSMGKLKATA